MRQLATLVTVADSGSLRRAAATLGLSQPAMSKTLRALEDAFDRPLFTRDAPGLRETPHGSAVIHYARRLMRDLGALAQTLEAIDSGAGGRLRIGVIPYVATDWLHAVIERMLQAPPAVLQVVEGATDILVDALRRRELDCVIGRVTPALASDDLRTRVLFHQHLRVLARAGHRLLRRGRPTSLKTLAAHEWLLPPTSTPTRQLFDQAFLRAGLPRPRVRVETYALHLVTQLLSISDALAAVPNDIAEQCVRGGGFGMLSHAWELPPVCLVWLSRDEDNALIRRLAQAVAIAPPERPRSTRARA